MTLLGRAPNVLVMTNTENAKPAKTDIAGNTIITEYNNGTDYAVFIAATEDGYLVAGTTFSAANYHDTILDAVRDLNEAVIDDIDNLIDAGDLAAADALGDYRTHIVAVFDL